MPICQLSSPRKLDNDDRRQGLHDAFASLSNRRDQLTLGMVRRPDDRRERDGFDEVGMHGHSPPTAFESFAG
jgi:hypothetical protein